MKVRLMLASGMLLAVVGAAAAQSAAPAAKPAPAGSANAVFPSSVSSKYASERPARARLHTCRDQYQANKATGGNGGLKWLQKGGGYYSECNKRLKAKT